MKLGSLAIFWGVLTVYFLSWMNRVPDRVPTPGEVRQCATGAGGRRYGRHRRELATGSGPTRPGSSNRDRGAGIRDVALDAGRDRARHRVGPGLPGLAAVPWGAGAAA